MPSLFDSPATLTKDLRCGLSFRGDSNPNKGNEIVDLRIFQELQRNVLLPPRANQGVSGENEHRRLNLILPHH